MKFKNYNISYLYKLFFCFFIVFFLSFQITAQQKNFSYFKLCVTNKKNEILSSFELLSLYLTNNKVVFIT